MHRRTFLSSGALVGASLALPGALRAEDARRLPVRVHLRETVGALPHIWEECAGSDRAALTMRESWRRDLDQWRTEAGLKRVRFHGIFSDELGVNAPSILSRDTAPNWQNVDRVYDGLVERGMSPFVELSFMPKRLASGTGKFGFYDANISPPTSLDAWAGFIRNFVAHLADRYGMKAVLEWPFEVWNEPNLPFFWSGNQQQYFDLYKATAVAVKSVDTRLMVGGPATSSTAWIGEFLSFCAGSNAPVDFIASHAYAGDQQAKVFGEDLKLSQNDVIPEAVRRARAKIDATQFKGMPFWLSEWSADSPAMIAHVVSGCLPYAQATAHWTLSNVYEELGVANYILKEGSMGWGAINNGIALPAFNTYRLLHRLGNERLAAEGPVLASKRENGRVAALVWNLAEVKQPAGIPGSTATRDVSGDTRILDVRFENARAGQRVHVTYADWTRGCPMPAWRAMGSPQYPTLAQIEQLRRASALEPPVAKRLDQEGRISLELPPEGIALIEFAA